MLVRLRLIAINLWIGAILLMLAIDALPSPAGLQAAVRPLLASLGIQQGSWNLFAPEPDHVNTRLRAEIAYRDGEQRVWTSPEWRTYSAWQMFTHHRRREWLDHVTSTSAAPAWEAWCRYLARSTRPDFEHADRGAEVRVIYQEALVPPAEDRPWPSMRTPLPYDSGWTLTIEKLP
jgi:hypothetical protein